VAVYEPKISGVTITANPVSINASFLISVSAADVEAVMYKVYPISGTIKSGQSVALSIHKEVSS